MNGPKNFTLVRVGRGKQSGKKRGGGLPVFVNSNWCGPTVPDMSCWTSGPAPRTLIFHTWSFISIILRTTRWAGYFQINVSNSFDVISISFLFSCCSKEANITAWLCFFLENCFRVNMMHCDRLGQLWWGSQAGKDFGHLVAVLHHGQVALDYSHAVQKFLNKEYRALHRSSFSSFVMLRDGVYLWVHWEEGE